jgi:hypothetical protein
MNARYGQAGHQFDVKCQLQWGIGAMSPHAFVYINVPSKLREMTCMRGMDRHHGLMAGGLTAQATSMTQPTASLEGFRADNQSIKDSIIRTKRQQEDTTETSHNNKNKQEIIQSRQVVAFKFRAS